MKKSLVFLSLMLTAALVAVGLITAGESGAAAPAQPTTLSAATYTVTLPLVLKTQPLSQVGYSAYGINFISAADSPADENRYQKAIDTGTDWNRWPLYWYNVETSQGVFNWSYGDGVVAADLAHGLETQLILMGTPPFYSTGGSLLAPLPQVGQRADGWQEPVSRYATEISSVTSPPAGLNQSVFTDGSDEPGTGKTINPSNPWARFVFQAVSHYSAVGITHFEIWNEQDYSFFWSGSPADYARLLKVAYLAAEQANPNAQISFGGLANFEKPTFLADVLAVLNIDNLAPSYNWFFDILATHSYAYAWESWYQVWRADRSLSNYGLDKPIWLNESGSPAWNDYPGPTWDPNSGYRSTMEEGAAYVIQSAMYAKYAGADVIFHFQLYDDCGNCPAGSDFPLNDGSICDPNNTCGTCAGDAFGLFRNPVNAACYTQHPSPDTPRPVYDAYRVLTTYLQDAEPLWRKRPGGTDPYNGPQEWIAFYQPDTQTRVLGLWARFGDPQTAVVPATSNSALLVDHHGNTSTITPVGGYYTLNLAAATNQNLSHDPSIYAIGGPPLILVETDTWPPETNLQLPALVPPDFQLRWSAEDLGSGLVDQYDVWLSVDGGPLSLWLQDTSQTQAIYSGQVGHSYGFAVTGRDRAGNQNPPPSQVQAETLVVNNQLYLPVIQILS